jgi:hypothetical protein
MGEFAMKYRSAGASTVRNLLFGCAIFLFAPAAVLAQGGRGSVSGLVSDPSGAVVPTAKVTILNHATAITESTITTAAGLYSFVSLSPGLYQVTATASGFETVVKENVTVSVDQVSTVNFAMRLGKVSEVVTVSGSTDLVDTDNSTVGQLITAQVIDRVPLLTRDVFQLVQLSAGVLPANATPNASDTQNIFLARPEIDVSSYTINGALQGQVYYMLDGSPIGIAENNSASIIPAFQVPEDGVDEYRVETQNTPATYQSGGGGVISLVTKSGGEKFHGDGFVYIRPNALAANDYFNKLYNPGSGTPDYHRYQEGGAISGPILRKKLFFFGDYEGTQQESYDPGGTFTVPTAAERTGDFSADHFTVYDPLLPDKADGTRQAFPGNKIPQADLNPIALSFAQKFPAANQPGVGPYHSNNFIAPGLDPLTSEKFDVRLDYHLSDKQNIFGRFSFTRLFFSNANFFDNDYDSYYFQNTTNARNVLLADDLTLSSTSVLQLRYSFTRHFENQTGDPRQLSVNIATLGFPQSLASQVRYPDLPVMNFGDGTEAIGGTNNYNTFIFASENSDAGATYSKSLGKHELSAGAEYQKRYMNVGQPPYPAGQYGFDNTPTSSTTFAGDGSDFASFLLGMGQTPGSESTDFTIDLFAAESNPYYGLFVQDNYHLTHSLTLNLGLRWDIFGGRNERHNRLEYFDPTLQASSNSVSYTGGEVFARSGARSPFDTNFGNVGPRASFAWQPVHRFVLRGGAGIYYGPSSEMVGNTGLDSDGYSTQTNWDSTNYNADGNTIFNTTANCPNNGLVTGCYSLSNPFPGGLVEPVGSSLGAATNLGSTLATVLHSERTLTTYNFNFGFEYEFPHETVFSAAYVGSRGLFLPLGSADLNQLSLQTIGQYRTSLCVVPDSTCIMVPNTWEAIQPATNANYGLSTVPLWVVKQPYPQFGNGGYGGGNGVNVNGYPGGDSDYSSLQMKVEKRMTKHFTTLAAFTWGKLITDDAAPPLGFVGYHGVGAPQDWKNLNLEHSLSAQDVKDQFNWQLSYDLPVGKGRAVNLNGAANEALGGWTVNTVVYLSTGVPIASPNGTENPYFAQRVNLNCDPGKGAPHNANDWFNYTCFSQPADLFAPGTAPAFLGSIRTDGAHQLDVSVYKNFTLPREMNLRFEASAYNFTNSVQMGYPNVFWNPNPTPGPNGNMAGFGQVYNAANLPRQIQFGAKFTF